MNDETLNALKARGDQIKQALNAVLEQGKKLDNEIQESKYHIGEVDTGITYLRLCDQDRLILRPNQVYIFSICPGCVDCAALAALYETGTRIKR
jgi:hypothetical protein